jgi:hypothetical protein
VDDQALLNRAYAAYNRSDPYAAYPSGSCSSAMYHNDKWYVVLRNGVGRAEDVLAVYSLRSDGVLHRLRRWPKAIEEE